MYRLHSYVLHLMGIQGRLDEDQESDEGFAALEKYLQHAEYVDTKAKTLSIETYSAVPVTNMCEFNCIMCEFNCIGFRLRSRLHR